MGKQLPNIEACRGRTERRIAANRPSPPRINKPDYKEIERVPYRYWSEARKEQHRFKVKNRHHKKRANGGRGITSFQWSRIVQLCGNECIACGQGPVEQDHVLPVSQGGQHDVENIQPLCSGCNNGKGAQHIDYRNGSEEWLTW